MKKRQEGIKIKLTLIGGVIAILLVLLIAIIMQNIKRDNIIKANPELGRAMNYEEFTDNDARVEGTENIKFSVFFLRDINQDGYAEKIKGTCKQIGKEDTLYMEINVETAGMLKNAKIEIQGNNFYLQTALPKDNELKDNYIGDNVNSIEFNDLNNGTQKLLTGIVRSGNYSYGSSKSEAIGKNINNLSRKDNKIILTGIYVNENNEETQIRKEINLETDWYGITKANISTTTQNKSLENIIDEEHKKVNLDFTVYTNEVQNELLLSKNYVEGEIPKLNEYEPTKVEYTGNVGTFNYDKETRKFTIERTAKVDEQGNITSTLSRNNNYGIKVEYPLEAYQTLGTETIQIKIPVKTYYEGYNNTNKEFTDPYKSNVANSTIVVNYEKAKGTVSRFDVTVGKSMYNPSYRYVISKEKPLRIYNGISAEEKGDTYTVLWRAYIGTGENLPGIVMKETRNGEQQVKDKFIKTDSTEESTEDVVSNVGIYFNGADTILGEDGWIKIYNEETGDLIVTFTKNEWNKYSNSNPYRYEIPVKNIKIETSNVVSDESYLYAYNIKEINDNKITEKYIKEQFDELQYIKSTLAGYLGETNVNTDTHQANYEAPISVADINISKNTISTQVTEKKEILTIETEANENYNEVKWKNGIFLVKFPEEIIDAKINSVEVNNSKVNIESYELIEKDNCKYIKIVTKNDNEATYTIKIDVDLSPDPRKATSTRNIELYATNENGANYYYKAQDIYDVNNNLNMEEKVNYRTTSISMVSPNSLLTNQIASDYDKKGSQVISPQIADIKPIYAVVDQEQKVQTVKIGVQLKNNYASTTSEIQILGKLPFEGNTYVINGAELGSTFTTKLQETGIELPEELKGIATVYYSENENPDKEIGKAENGWKKSEAVTNWNNIKTYLIDLSNYVMPTGKEFVFNYTVEIPNGLAFNEVSYSHHAIYFCLDTDEGKYKTETEPNKLGLRIAEKYNLELTKYQTGKDKLVPGATYRITDEETGESKTGVTNAEGKLTVQNLYAEKAYIIQEIKTPDNYELNSNIIRFIGHVDNEGNLTIEQTEGFTKGDITVTKVDGEEYKVNVQVEDEVKATIKLHKKEMGTDNLIKGVRFKLTGYNLNEGGKNVTTNANGETTLRGLSVNKEYTLEEVRAEGYYLASPIKFKIVNNNGNYSIEVLEGEKFLQNTVEENGIPTINVTLKNEKIPTYDLELIKVKRVTPVKEGENSINEDLSQVENDTQVGLEEKAIANEKQAETEYLQGAKFKLYKGTEEIGNYTTDATGKVTISGLYMYEKDKNIDQTYTLKEVLAPDGYAKVKDITFKVQNENGALVLKELNEAGEEINSKRYTAEGNIIKLTIEDSPSFKLIKKDGETGEVLPNTKFAIYNVDEGEIEARNSKGEIIGTKEVINGREYYTVTTNAKGELTLDLPEGLYKAVEVKASDEKYDISGATYYFGIGGSKELEEIYGAKKYINLESFDARDTIATEDEGILTVGGTSKITIDGEVIESEGSEDATIIKYNKNGDIEWYYMFGSTGYDYVKKVAQLSDNSYVFIGYVEDRIYIDRERINEEFVLKLSENGQREWIKAEDDINLYDITETVDNGFYIAGTFSDSITINGTSLQNDGVDGIFVKCNSEGEYEWARQYGGNDSDFINDIISTTDGGIALVGETYSEKIKIEDQTLNKIKSNNGVDWTKKVADGIIIKYTTKGEYMWAHNFSGDAETEVTKVIEEPKNGIYVSGFFEGNNFKIDTGEKLQNNYGGGYGNDSYVIKYNLEGNIEWYKNIGKRDYDELYDMTGLNNGGVAIVRTSGYYMNRGTYKIELFNTEGNLTWERDFIEGKLDTITADKNGNIYATGSGTDIDLGIEEKVNGNFLVKYGNIYENTYYVDTNESFKIKNLNINEIKETSNEEKVLVGSFSEELNINGTVIKNDSKFSSGIIIKLDKHNNVEWYDIIKGDDTEEVNKVNILSDGYITAGSFGGRYAIINNEIINKVGNQYTNDSFIIKYNLQGEIQWVKILAGENNEEISAIGIDKNEEIVLTGQSYSSKLIIGNDMINFLEKDISKGFVIKLSKEGDLIWNTIIEGDSDIEVNDVECKNNIIAVVGRAQGFQIRVQDINLKSEEEENGFVMKFTNEGKAEWVKTIESEQINSYQHIYDKYISVEIDKNENIIAGGHTEKDIGVITSYAKNGTVNWKYTLNGLGDEDFSDLQIVNDKIYSYVKLDLTYNFIQIGNQRIDTDSAILQFDLDGKLKIATEIDEEYPNYDNSMFVKNNSDVIVSGRGFYDTYTLDYKVPEIQELTVENNRKEFKITTDVNEIDGIKGGDISGEDLSPYETIKYGDSSTKEIIMTPEENYEIIRITVNGEEWKFEKNEDGTYIMPQFTNITENKHIEVTYALKDNKLIIDKVDSKTGKPLQGAKFRVEQIEERTNPENAIGEIVANGTYNFIKNENGGYESNNQGIDNTTANSYIPIDLTNCTGKYNLTVNANISSDYDDYGYATIATSTERVEHSNSNGRFIHISGTSSSSTTAKDYTTIIQGGQKYYLHLGYYKGNEYSEGEDKFTINNIKLTLNTSELYNTVVTTNNEGKAITQLPFGKYKITEIKSPEGYELLETPVELEFRADGNHEITISNMEKSKIIIHHYLKTKEGEYTTTKVAEDDYLEGKQGENYTTNPKLDLEKYKLEKDTEGNYIIPENAIGTYKLGIQEVIYYYEEKDIPLVVHHYIEGTEEEVPLADGGIAEDERYIGKEGERYKTTAISEKELSERYELVEIPLNAEGTYTPTEIIVTYYYRLKQSKLIIKKVDKQGEVLAGAIFKIVNKETLKEWQFTTDKNGEIELVLDNGEYKVTEVKSPDGYKLLKEPILVNVEVNKENYITIENEKYKEFDFIINKKDSVTKQKISGVKFKLTYIDQYGVENTKKYITDAEGTIKISNLYNDIEYHLQEISTAPGYVLDNQIYTFNVKYTNGEYILNTENTDLKNVHIEGNVINVDINNEPSFKLIKEGEDGERLEGAKFTITDNNGNEVVDAENKLVGEVEIIDGKEKRVITTNSLGELSEKLLPGKYIVTEVKAPQGYKMPENEIERMQRIEIKSGQTERIIKEKESDFEGILNNLDFIFNSIQINNISANDNETVIYGILYDNLTIPKEYTKQGQDIVLERGIENGIDGIIMSIDYDGKIEEVRQIKSEENTINGIDGGAEDINGNMIAIGVYINSVTIQADKTENGEKLQITNSEATEEYPGIYLIAYNENGKVKELKDITYMQELILNGTKISSVLDKYIIRGNISSDSFVIPAEQTTEGKEIIVNNDFENDIILILNSEGKVINAKLEQNIVKNDYSIYIKETLTTSETIVGGYLETGEEIRFSKEETENGQDIVLQATQDDSIIVKYNTEGKVSWVNKIRAENGYCMMIKIQEVSDGYLGIVGFENSLKVNTVDGDEVKLEAENEGVALIKFNKQGIAEWVNDITADMNTFYSIPEIKELVDGYIFIDMYETGNSILYEKVNPNIAKEQICLTMENRKEKELNIPVSKIWEDDNNKLGQRPTRVVFKLTGSDGNVYTKELAKPGTEGSTTTQDSNNLNKWNDIFENLPKYDINKQEIAYTLTEITGDLKYYEATVDETSRTVTNTNRYGKVTVHHYIMNTDGSTTTTKVPSMSGAEVQDVVIEGKTGDSYKTESAKDISTNYELVAEKLPANATGILEKYNAEKPQEVIYYYKLKPAKVIINYLEKDEDIDDSNNQVLENRVEINGYVDEKYNTNTNHRKETIEKEGKTYTLVEDSKNTEGTMTLQDISVTYYYLQNSKATVRYVERNPETGEIVKDLEEPTVKEGLVGDEFVTNSKNFLGYRLVESPEKTTINLSKEEQTLIYYYEPVATGLIENHIDDVTGKILETKKHDIEIGEEYSILSKIFEGYDLVETKLPENATGTMKEELITVNYYYIKKAVLEVNYINREIGKTLAEQIVDNTKHEGDKYTTEEKSFEGYDLVKVEGSKEGTMVVETDENGKIINNKTVVTYYYARKSAGVEEHHIDFKTNKEIEEPILHEGHIGDEYDIKAKDFLSYKLVEKDEEGNSKLPENATGTMTEEKIVVNYYYNQPAKVVVHYVEKATGKELEEKNQETGELQSSQIVINGLIEDEYKTEAKEFEYYTLIETELPQNAEGKMKVEIVENEKGEKVVNNTIDVYYYYQAKPFNIGVEKEITGIVVNGERKEISNGKLEKIEIYRKKAEETSVQVEYKIKVRNTGEIAGTAIIEEKLPEGMKIANNDEMWEEKDGKLIKVIPEIGAGETKEYTVLLNWEQTGENMGEKANEVKLVETGNVPGFVDNNDKDNTSKASTIISVETGKLPLGLILVLVALVGLETITLRYAVVLTKKQKKK